MMNLQHALCLQQVSSTSDVRVGNILETTLSNAAMHACAACDDVHKVRRSRAASESRVDIIIPLLHPCEAHLIPPHCVSS